jgi:signal transduction histidine kinase
VKVFYHYSIFIKVLPILLYLLPLNVFGQEYLISGMEGLSAKDQVKTLLEACDEVITTEPETAIVYANKALSLSEENGYELEQAQSLYNLGVAYIYEGNFDKSLENLSAGKAIYEKLNNKIGVVLCYKQIGILYSYVGSNEKALQNYIQAYDLAKEINLKTELLRLTNNIGIIYLNQHHLDLAIEYFQRSLEMGPEKDIEAIIIGNIGLAYRDKNDLVKALEYFEKSVEICREINNINCEVSQLGYIATIYLDLEEYDRALKYSYNTQKKQVQLGLRRDLVITYNRMGLAFRYKQQYDSALIYLNKSLKLAWETKSASLHLIYANLAMTYEDSKQYKLALEHLFEYQDIKDSLFTIEKNRQTEELLTKYETERKEQEIALLHKEKEYQAILLKNQEVEFASKRLQKNLETQQKERKISELRAENELQLVSLQREKAETGKRTNHIKLLEKEKELQEAELERQGLVRNIAVIGAFLILIVALIFLITYQQKIKAQELLSLKTKEFNEQKNIELLRENEISAIKANIEGQEKERERIAQELHDGIAGNLASIKLNLAKLTIDVDKNMELQKVIKYVDETYHEVRTISHHLIPPKIKDSSFIELIGNFLDEQSQNHPFEVYFEYYPKSELNMLPYEITIEVYRIVQELMNNIVKHAHADRVDLQITKLEGYVNLMIEDTGVGFDISKTSDGIGLNNITSRVSVLHGEIDIDTSINRGTIVNINIPVA